MYLNYSFILIISLFFPILQAGDSSQDPLSKQWVALAHDLSLGQIGYFHWLPTDIQANIFSRIHPQPSLDDCYSNNLLCIKNITVPHLIVSFDIKGDRLAYMGSQKGKFLSYKPYWIDLKTDDCHSPCELGADDEYPVEAIPRIEWCGDVILFEGYGNEIDPSTNKHLFAVNIFGQKIGHYPMSHVSALAAHDTWKAHASMPLLVIGKDLQQYNFFEINDKVLKINSITCGWRYFRVVSWSSNLPNASIYSPSESNTHIVSAAMMHSTFIIRPIEGEPYFSPDDSRLYAKRETGLVEYDIELKKEKFYPLSRSQNKFLLRGVGNSTYLAEDRNAEGYDLATYSLCSLNDGSGIPLTELSNL